MESSVQTIEIVLLANALHKVLIVAVYVLQELQTEAFADDTHVVRFAVESSC